MTMSKTKSSMYNNRNVKTQSKPVSTTGPPASDNKRKNRKNITLGMKLEIIRRLEQGQSNSSICHEYNLPSSTVSTIRSKKEQIKAFCTNSAVQDQYYQISIYPRNNIIEEVEQSLYKWIKDRNFQLETVRYRQVRDKALKFFEEAKRKLPEHDTSHEKIRFKASTGWFDRFRKRFTSKLNENAATIIPNTTMVNGSSSGQNLSDMDVEDENSSPMATIIDNRTPSIDEPITVIEEGNDNIMNRDNFANDMMELFWGKVVSSIFSNEKCRSGHLDAKSLAIVFKLSEAIVNILESRDPDKRRFLLFKQSLAQILHPYREIYNRELSTIKDSLRNLYSSNNNGNDINNNSSSTNNCTNNDMIDLKSSFNNPYKI